MTTHKPTLSFTYDSCGYMLFADGHPIGGAGTNGTATRTSWGAVRHWRAVRTDLKMNAELARRDINAIQAGGGQKRFCDAIAALAKSQTP